MSAPVSPSQPRADETRRLVNGEFYAKRDKIFRAPIETKTEGGTNISVGFPVCHVSDYVDADNLVEHLNASREVDSLKARIQELEGALRPLAKELDGFLSVYSHDMRAAAGNTNVAVLYDRLASAEITLSSASNGEVGK